MSNNKVTDEWLYKTMPAIDEALINNLEKDIDFNYEFTSDFETRMQKLLTKNHTTSIKSRRLLRFNKMAASVVAILVILATTATSVLAYRIGLFTTIRTVWEDSVLYTYLFPENEETEVRMNYIRPISVPKGYEQIDEKKGNLLYSIVFENDEGNQIIWDQQLVTESLSLVLDKEYQWTKDISINENLLEIYGYDDGYTISYYEYNGFVFTIMADDLSVEQIIEMIN